MEVQTSRDGDITLIKVTGDVTVENVGQFRDGLENLIGDGVSKIVLDFGECNHLCSQGFGTIAMNLKRVREKDGDIKLANLTPRVKRIFDVTRLTKVMDIFEGAEEAVGSFSGGATAAK